MPRYRCIFASTSSDRSESDRQHDDSAVQFVYEFDAADLPTLCGWLADHGVPEAAFVRMEEVAAVDPPTPLASAALAAFAHSFGPH